MRATLSNHHQSPRKVRLVANLIRGKSVRDARMALSFLPKKSSPVFTKLLASAVANVRGESVDNLMVKKITVDKGRVYRRSRPFARGRSGALRKTLSHITIELGAKTSGNGLVARASKAKAKK